jgi:hypothetical protein
MLIDQTYFRGNKIVLRDMDGSEVLLTFDDAKTCSSGCAITWMK